MAEYPVADWIMTNTDSPLVLRDLGSAHFASGTLVAVDPLVSSPEHGAPRIPVPAGSARILLFFDEFGRVSKAMAAFSAAVPVCGAEVAAMPVDAGMGAFLDESGFAALAALSEGLFAAGGNLYDDFVAAQMTADPEAAMLQLPTGERLPVFSTGWGDGVYPVVCLKDAQGGVAAVYADFMGRDESGEWLLPPACDG